MPCDVPLGIIIRSEYRISISPLNLHVNIHLNLHLNVAGTTLTGTVVLVFDIASLWSIVKYGHLKMSFLLIPVS